MALLYLLTWVHADFDTQCALEDERPDEAVVLKMSRTLRRV